MLTKEIEEQVTITASGNLEVRESTIILEDGIELSRTYHRRVIMADDKVTKESKKIKAIMKASKTK